MNMGKTHINKYELSGEEYEEEQARAVGGRRLRLLSRGRIWTTLYTLK